MIDLNKIYQGDSLKVLKTFPDSFVDCCVTSPPYWGLRDYGTAKWEGGDEKCDHRTFDNDIVNAGEKQKTNAGSNRTFKDICKRCGATRIDAQMGLEKTPEEYVNKMVEVFREVRRVLKDEGTLWLNLGDTYSAHKDCKSVSDSLRVGGKSESANIIEKGMSHSHNTKMLKSVGLKNKDLIGIPWRVAFALQSDGWYLRQDIIWAKPNPMPESVTDRCTKSHEYIFLLAKSQKYYFDNVSIQEPAFYDNCKDEIMKGSAKYKNSGQTIAERPHARWNKNINGKRIRNKRSVWIVPTKPFKEAHFATFPEKLIQPCILAGCPQYGIVLDPFMGAGTTALVAEKLNRKWIGIELNPEYIKIANERIDNYTAQGRLFYA